MIVTKFYKGQGLGNQLWVYATLRSIARRNGYEFGIESKNNFKLRNTLKIDLGKTVLSLPHEKPYGIKPCTINQVIYEQLYNHKGSGKNVICWQKEIENIKDRTKIEGYFQSTKYIESFRKEFTEEFQCNHGVDYGKDTCVINLRGGDYLGNPQICLNRNYYLNAIKKMRERGIEKFVVVTDDAKYASKLLPEFPVVAATINSKLGRVTEAKIAWDFSTLQMNENLILSNSTFAWWAAWTNKAAKCVIAPMYWAYPSNAEKIWSPQDIIVDEWLYIHDDDSAQFGQEIRKCGDLNLNLMDIVPNGIIKQSLDFRVRLKVWVYKSIWKRVKGLRLNR